MLHIQHSEAVDVARKIVLHRLDIEMVSSFKEIVLNDFDRQVSRSESVNMGCDHFSDYLDDCVKILNTAIQFSSLIKDYRSDSMHNGRPTRWLKFSSELALQGKTMSALLIKDKTTLGSNEAGNELSRVNCELHQIKKSECIVTPFSLSVYYLLGRHIDRVGGQHSEQREDNNVFYAFIFPALELLGYQTPRLYSWSGVWNDQP